MAGQWLRLVVLILAGVGPFHAPPGLGLQLVLAAPTPTPNSSATSSATPTATPIPTATLIPTVAGDQPGPTAVLKAVPLVGPCRLVLLDASLSATPVLSLLQFHWASPNGPAPLQAALAAATRALPPGRQLQLRSDLFPNGVAVEVALTVVDALGRPSQASVNVTRTADRVLASPGPLLEAHRWAATVLSIQPLVLACPSRDGDGPGLLTAGNVRVNWQHVEPVAAGEPGALRLLGPLMTTNSPELILQPFTLAPAAVHMYEATVYNDLTVPDLGLVARLLLQLQVGPPRPLVAVIAGGNRRVASTRSFTLNASQSYDHNRLPDSGPLTFSWATCLLSGNVCSEQVGLQRLQDEGAGTGPVLTLMPPRGGWFTGTYRITVTATVADGTRSGATAVQVQVVTALVPEVQVFWHPPLPRQLVLNHQDTLRVTSRMLSAAGAQVQVQYAWTVAVDGLSIDLIPAINGSRGPTLVLPAPFTTFGRQLDKSMSDTSARCTAPAQRRSQNAAMTRC